MENPLMTIPVVNIIIPRSILLQSNSNAATGIIPVINVMKKQRAMRH